MSAEAFDWLVVLALLTTCIGVCAGVAGVVEWFEHRRKQRELNAWRQWGRVPPPNWRSHRGGRDYW